MPNQTDKVKSFFDRIADTYHKRYDGSNIFHQYFFQERLEEATKGVNFEGKTILDIGAGTGALYDYLKVHTHTFDYYASDIAPKMKAASAIPSTHYFIGSVDEIDFPIPEFDFIYMLGVSTYLSQKDLSKSIQFIADHLKKDGYAYVSFTNRSSIDFKLRRLLQGLNGILPLKEKVSGQSFKFFAYRKKEVENLINKDLTIHEVIFLNQTIPPFSRLMPTFSIQLAKWIKAKISAPTLLKRLSSDFLITIAKK